MGREQSHVNPPSEMARYMGLPPICRKGARIPRIFKSFHAIPAIDKDLVINYYLISRNIGKMRNLPGLLNNLGAPNGFIHGRPVLRRGGVGY